MLTGALIAHSPVSANPSATAAPAGKTMPVIVPGARVNKGPTRPSPIQSTDKVTAVSTGRNILPSTAG